MTAPPSDRFVRRPEFGRPAQSPRRERVVVNLVRDVVGSLSRSWIGENANGTWTLEVDDAIIAPES